SEPISVTTPANKLSLNLRGFDNSKETHITVEVDHRHNASQIFRANYDIRKNGLTFVGNVYANGAYAPRSIVRQPRFGQVCHIDNLGSYTDSGGKDAAILVDCLTPANITAIEPSISIQVGSKNQIGSGIEVKRISDNETILTDEFTYSSSNDEIVKVNEEGTLSGKSEGTARITVTLNPDAYGDRATTSYEVTVSDSTHYVINKIDFGQALIQKATDPYQVMSAGAGFIIRAYPEAKTNNKDMPTLKFYVVNDGEPEQIFDMICPTSLDDIVTATPDFGLEKSCYAKVSRGDNQFIKGSSSYYIKDESSSDKYVIQPKFSKHSDIKVVVIPVNVDKDGDGRGEIEANINSIDDIKKALTDALPFSVAEVSIREPIVSSSDSIVEALNIAERIRQAENGGDTSIHYYAMVKGVCWGQVGLGFVGTNHSASGRDADCDRNVQRTMVHELGHNLSLNHAPTPEGCGSASGADSFWTQIPQPWVGASEGKMNPDVPIYVKSTGETLQPKVDNIWDTTATDVMGYCSGYHLTSYHYKKAADYATNYAGYIPLSATPEALTMIQGVISTKGVVTYKPITSRIGIPLVQSDVKAILSVNNNGKIMDYGVGLVTEGESNERYFTLEIPKSNISELTLKKMDGTHYPYNEINRGKTLLRSFNPDVSIHNGRVSVVWDNNQYPWVDITSINYDGEVKLMTIQNQLGNLELDIPAHHNDGEILAVFSDGLNTKTVRLKH
ncbi:Ig-like domain-containing protein, partial [Aliivibrio sp. S2MY1]|uniref:Ig-like domain-containing protein n=3 Tax=unclassified Aliivibrio TaxID=2645654 RepID=UPI002379D03C